MKQNFLFLLFVISILGSCQSLSSEETAKTNEPDNNSVDYLVEGSKITATAFAALSSKLQSALQEGGVANAVSYCNVAALPLIDSLSKAHKVRIKRTSLKYRNPMDAPTETEIEVLNTFANQLQNGEAPSPLVKSYNFYAPIIIAPPCLKCHGKTGETLAESDYKHILKAYPEDKAIGYLPGDLRGMWVVSFEK